MSDDSNKRSSPKRQHVGEISRAAATYKRKKTTSACQVCRARRTKCDNGRPCSYCRRNGHECISSNFDEPRWDPATLHILEKLDSLQKQLDGVSNGMAARSSSVDASSPLSTRTGVNSVRLNVLSEESLCVSPGRSLHHVERASDCRRRALGAAVRVANTDM